MSNLYILIGLVGASLVVTGSAWPENKKDDNPRKSIKNWLFASGSLIMLLYALFLYIYGGSALFILLQILIVISSILMMLNTPDRIDIPIIGSIAIILIILSLIITNNYYTIIFIFGLSGKGMGYAFQTGTIRRSVLLTIGSTLIGIFSFIEKEWIYLILNIFFLSFSFYYLVKILRVSKYKFFGFSRKKKVEEYFEKTENL